MLRPYTIKEQQDVEQIVSSAQAHANRKVGYTCASDLRKNTWNLVFHQAIEAECCKAGLRQPRSFFERGAKRYGFDRD